jgi:hypothetical protein
LLVQASLLAQSVSHEGGENDAALDAGE